MLVAQAVGHGRRRLIQKQPPWLAALGIENVTQQTRVYLLTFARVLSDRLQRGDLKDVTELSRQDIFNCVRDAWENPRADGLGGGRPRSEETGSLLQKVVVYEESHADGAKHFHVAVLLSRQMRFGACRRTLLERHGLAAHVSSTHTQWWSAVRYGMESETKPVVDQSPLLWVPEGQPPIDLFEDSQGPYTAGCKISGRTRLGLGGGRSVRFFSLARRLSCVHV